MREPSDADLYDVVRQVWEARDPVPDGMVARMQAAAALATSEWQGGDLDMELMLLVERSAELTGARSGSATSYTLRFAHDGVDLLLRVSGDQETARVDGWVVPPTPVSITVLRDGPDGLDGPASGGESAVEVGATGRFELTGLRRGLLRVRLSPTDGSTPFVTPYFEI